MLTREITLHLPTPYPMQDSILNSPAKRKVIVAGRRAGKTTIAACIASERFIDGDTVILTSTTQDQADVFWRKVKEWISPLIQHKVITKNETKRLMLMPNGGRLRVKTGSNPDVLRGDDADLIVFDECALLNPDTWYTVAAPMLADRGGDAVFISSPQRRNWFYLLYQKALQEQANGSDYWQAWHFSTLANPYLDQRAVAALAEDMTEDAYRQEILAEFLEGSGQVFRRIREAATLTRSEPYAGRFVMGVDWAQTKDYTALIVLDSDTGKMVDYDHFNKQDWALQRGRLTNMAQKWTPHIIMAEANSIGSPNIEALQREGLPVKAFTTTATTKPPLIESLVLAFERGDIHIIDTPLLVGELEAYERKVSPLTGHSQYSAPDGLHDDMVIALALAWYGKMQSIRNDFLFL